jgi:DNA-binding transcriptional regulator WhiA
VKYGIALAKKDLNDKLTLALTNTADTEEEKLGAKIVSLLDKDEPMKFGILVNKSTRSKNHTKEMVQPVIDKLLAAKMIIEIEEPSTNPKQKTVKSYLLP